MSKLHEDLVAIRKEQKLSVEDIYDKTRIAKENIQLIEDGSLFASGQNKTYIRSFARTYSRSLHISDDDMVKALDQYDAGNYDGSLRKKYLKSATDPVDTVEKPAADEKTELKSESKSGDKPTGETEDKPGAKPQGRQENKPQDKPKGEADSADEKSVKAGITSKYSFELDSPKPRTIKPGEGKPVSETPADKKPKVKPMPRVLNPRDKKGVDWSNIGKQSKQSSRKKSPLFAILVVLLLIAALAAAMYYFLNYEDSELSDSVVPAETTDQVNGSLPDEVLREPGADPLSDTLSAPVPPDPATAGSVVIPDTIYVSIYAVNGNLEPFRVSSDAFDGRRPYWLERGKAMRISFVESVTFWGQRDRMLFLYNDRVLTDFAEINEGENSITIRREQFTADPSLRSFTRADFPTGINPPTEIMDRPIIID